MKWTLDVEAIPVWNRGWIVLIWNWNVLDRRWLHETASKTYLTLCNVEHLTLQTLKGPPSMYMNEVYMYISPTDKEKCIVIADEMFISNTKYIMNEGKHGIMSYLVVQYTICRDTPVKWYVHLYFCTQFCTYTHPQLSNPPVNILLHVNTCSACTVHVYMCVHLPSCSILIHVHICTCRYRFMCMCAYKRLLENFQSYYPPTDCSLDVSL